MKRKTIFVFLFILFILINACEKKPSYTIYRGKQLSIYFDMVYNYTEKDFIVLDEYYVVHMKDIESPIIRNDSIFIYPRRFVYMEHPVTGNRREKVTNIQMAIGLYYGLNEINKKPGNNDKYIIDAPQFLLTKGELHLRKKSGKSITIKVPENYPLTIKIMKK